MGSLSAISRIVLNSNFEMEQNCMGPSSTPPLMAINREPGINKLLFDINFSGYFLIMYSLMTLALEANIAPAETAAASITTPTIKERQLKSIRHEKLRFQYLIF
jgi:hypothetical protein